MAFLPIYILILGFTIVVDYFAGIFIEISKGYKKKLLLFCSVVANIGVLAFFKYYNFLAESFASFLGEFGFHSHVPYLKILLPIGLSFHTFQALSYTIEVYRGNQKSEKHFGIYALYVMFYPQLVAGPIERPQNMLHQFREKHFFKYDRVVDGLKLMLWGFFKKIVIADRLALYVNPVFNNVEQHNSLTLLTATFFFAFQIYCDFSGYTDIARGSARVMGFNLMLNFNRPYFSKSIREFWSRWHISLSTWFRDYVYIPLGGNRVKNLKRYRNLLIVFIVSGLWHGANWTFVIWGFMHGIFLILGTFIKLPRQKFRMAGTISAQLFTFLLVCLSWIFFRANNLHDALTIYKTIFSMSPGPLFLASPSTFIYSIFGIFFLLLVEFKQEYYTHSFSILYNQYKLIRYVGYTVLILIILLIGVFNGGQFIYFQF
jgi:D-alanyl-lipoteichoic acid acyltransferase DltB (MBOAT superfamily)